jgi:hypothetical protein
MVLQTVDVSHYINLMSHVHASLLVLQEPSFMNYEPWVSNPQHANQPSNHRYYLVSPVGTLLLTRICALYSLLVGSICKLHFIIIIIVMS